MKIYYQWNPWSYMNIASKNIVNDLNSWIEDIVWLPDFSDVWASIWEKWIWVLAVENSYMWSIHPNLYWFLKYDFKIIWEYFLEIKHCICSKETDIENIKEVYSQAPALEQCHNYLKSKNIKAINYSDTSLSAKYVSESQEKWIWAICSVEAAKMHGLNILEENIADQKGNTTRFAIITAKDSKLEYKNKSNKISVIFQTNHIPASLYKCLWAFATNNINLTKIESIPSYKDSFSYMFWMDFEGNLNDKNVQNSLEELKFFTKEIRILGEY